MSRTNRDLMRRIQQLERRVPNGAEERSDTATRLTILSEETRQAIREANMLIRRRGLTLDDGLRKMSAEEREQVRGAYRAWIREEREAEVIKEVIE